jgi:hypothetical protein
VATRKEGKDRIEQHGLIPHTRGHEGTQSKQPGGGNDAEGQRELWLLAVARVQRAGFLWNTV